MKRLRKYPEALPQTRGKSERPSLSHMDDLRVVDRFKGMHTQSWYVSANNGGPTDAFASCSSGKHLEELFEDMRKGGEDSALLVAARSILSHGG